MPPIPARVVVLVALSAVAAASPAGRGSQGAPAAPVKTVVHDARLDLTVFASDPDIVTPIGIAVDAEDRVFVLESHTHLQGTDYAGPKGDRIKTFVDRDGNGVPESVAVFAEGLEDGMNLAFSASGDLYAVTAQAVWALHDRDRDGVSEARTRVLHLARPERVYDHAALLGITFSADGWLYVSRGNTGSAAWRLEGTDGSSVSGYGDGGNIVRCRPDGTRLQEIATGFWNPFDLAIDRAGRLLAIDNDPDSRGPNRLVHVVDGGHYGYQSLYGGSGIHPYLAWNGELPGTLPYAAPLGEAPSGVFVAARGALPPDYRDDVLVTIWEERRIDRVSLEAHGASVRGRARPLIEGGEGFRPVAFAADGRGSIYITDWVVREYANHGRGRIWRLKARADGDDGRLAPAAPLDGTAAAVRLLTASPALAADASFERLRAALLSEDPFIRHTATTALTAPRFRPQVVAALDDAQPPVRVGALLALWRSNHPDPEPLVRRLLGDGDALVRRMALVWAGRAGMLSLRPALDEAVAGTHVTPELFETYLATLEQLTPEFVETYGRQAEPYARNLARLLPPRFLEHFLADRTRPAALRALAVAHVDAPARQLPLLASLARDAGSPAVQLEAVRSLAMVTDPHAAAVLLELATGRQHPALLRAEAIVGLARQKADTTAAVLELLDDPAPAIRVEAARHLRSAPLSDDVRRRLETRVGETAARSDPEVRAQLRLGGIPAKPEPVMPSSTDGVLTGGDVEAGRRVFFSAGAACSQCHAIGRRGGALGPALTSVGRSKSRAQLLDAIVRPSAEISPEYQGWYVRTTDGTVHTGRQIDVGSGGRAELYVLSGEFITIENVAEYGPLPRSLMPDGLDQGLTENDMRNLLAFLEHGDASR